MLTTKSDGHSRDLLRVMTTEGWHCVFDSFASFLFLLTMLTALVQLAYSFFPLLWYVLYGR